MGLCALTTRTGDRLTTRLGEALAFRPTEECVTEGGSASGLPAEFYGRRIVLEARARRRGLTPATLALLASEAAL